MQHSTSLLFELVVELYICLRILDIDATSIFFPPFHLVNGLNETFDRYCEATLLTSIAMHMILCWCIIGMTPITLVK